MGGGMTVRTEDVSRSNSGSGSCMDNKNAIQNGTKNASRKESVLMEVGMSKEMAMALSLWGILGVVAGMEGSADGSKLND